MSGDTLSSNTAEGGNGVASIFVGGDGGNGLGGGIYNGSNLVSALSNLTLSANTAQGGSGGVSGVGGTGGNGLGGAIYVGYGSIELDTAAVSFNLAQGGQRAYSQFGVGSGEGGGLYITPERPFRLQALLFRPMSRRAAPHLAARVRVGGSTLNPPY